MPREPGSGSSVRRNVGPAVVLDAVAAGVRQVAMALVAQRQVSVGVLIVVAAFLLVQDRLDRSDPKLAAAPLVPLPDLPYETPTNHEDHR